MARFEGVPVTGLEQSQQETRSRFPGERINEQQESRKPYDGDLINTVREVLQGSSLGFSDELGAAVAAGIAWAKDGADFNEAYENIVGHVRDEQNSFREDSPYLSTAAQVVGGVATGGAGLERMAASQGTKLLPRLAQNAAAGTAAGGVAGAGFADEDKLEGAESGAKFGAVGGVVGGEVGRAIANKLSQRIEARKLVKEGLLSNEKTALLYKAPSGKIKPDHLAHEAVKMGAPKPVISLIKAGSSKDKAAIKKMIDLRRRSLGDRLFAAKNNPNEVMGSALKERIDYVRGLREQAGKQVNKAVKGLRGKEVDFSPAVDDFLDELDSAGIKFNPEAGELSFSGSDFEDLEGPMNVITRMVKRMYNSGKTPDAHDVHRLKKYIDENVNYGKNTEGTAKSYAERMIKKLRHNIDGVLDGRFPEYDKANTQFSEATAALGSIQDALGKSFDLDAKNIDRMLGQKGRGLLSNAVYGRKLEESLLMMDDLAESHGKVFGDDLHLQASLAAALEEMLGTTQKTSLQGVTESAISHGARAATGDGVGAGFAIVDALKKSKSANDPEAMLDVLAKIAGR